MVILGYDNSNLWGMIHAKRKAEDLEAENNRLRDENKKLKSEIEALKERISELEK